MDRLSNKTDSSAIDNLKWREENMGISGSAGPLFLSHLRFMVFTTTILPVSGFATRAEQEDPECMGSNRMM